MPMGGGYQKGNPQSCMIFGVLIKGHYGTLVSALLTRPALLLLGMKKYCCNFGPICGGGGGDESVSRCGFVIQCDKKMDCKLANILCNEHIYGGLSRCCLAMVWRRRSGWGP